MKLRLRFFRFSKIKLTAREIYLSVVTVLVIGGALGYRYVIEPSIDRWNRLNGELIKKKSWIIKGSRMLIKKDAIEQAYAKLKEYLDTGESDQQEFSLIMKEIQQIARKNRVAIVRIKPGPVKNYVNHRLYRVDASVEAEIAFLIKFLYDIETSRKLLKVKRMILTSKGTKTKLLKASLQIERIAVQGMETNQSKNPSSKHTL